MVWNESEYKGLVGTSRWFGFGTQTENIGAVREDIIKARKLASLLEQRQAETQVAYEQQFRKMLHQIRVRDGVAIKDRFLESIRGWYVDYKDKNGKFPELPSEEEGGSKLIHAFLQSQLAAARAEATGSPAATGRNAAKVRKVSPVETRPITASSWCMILFPFFKLKDIIWTAKNMMSLITLYADIS